LKPPINADEKLKGQSRAGQGLQENMTFRGFSLYVSLTKDFGICIYRRSSAANLDFEESTWRYS
jgi:hypothetical protein